MVIRVGRTAWLIGTALAIGGGAAMTVVGCSGDDTAVSGKDAGNDATAGDGGVDSSGDVTSPTDSGVDTGVDSAPPFDAFGIDAESLIDAPALGDFLPTVAATVCSVLRQCCGVTTANWDEAQCERDQGVPNIGFANANRYAAAFDSGNVFYEKGLADKCIADIQSILLGSDGGSSLCGSFPASLYEQINVECISAVTGTSPLDGGTCQHQGECAAGGYCLLPADGGIGACAPVNAVGGACALPTSEDCNYMDLNMPADYCDLSGDAGGHCAAQVGVDAGCSSDVQCLSDFCFGTCLSGGVFSDPGTPGGECASYTLGDGGP